MNPFAYNTVTIGFKGVLSEIVGVNADISIAVNMKALRELDAENFEIAILVNVPITVGPQAEGAVFVELGGYNYSIDELAGLNPILVEGSASINASICDGLCVGAGTTIDAYDHDGISSIRYSLGGGAGYELSAGIIGVSDIIAQQHGYGKDAQTELNVPIINSGFWKEVDREIINPARQIYKYISE